MQLKTKFTIGKATYELLIDEKEEMDTLLKAAVLSNPPSYCQVCKNSAPSDFSLTGNKDKESNIYINVRCRCGSSAKLGQYKSGGYFWHKFEQYVPKGSDTRKDSDDEDFDKEPAKLGDDDDE